MTKEIPADDSLNRQPHFSCHSLASINHHHPTINTMRPFLFAIALIFTAHCNAQIEVRKAEEAQPTGEEVLRIVRMSQALQDLKHLQGFLRNDETGKEVPMELSMTDNIIRFLFRDPAEIINLDLNNNGTKLTRIVPGSGKVEIPASLNATTVRDTHINYEDLSMRFLYWPNAKIIDEETVSFMKCWKVRVVNPDGKGPYGTVDIWVHKASGAIAKMEAYDAKGVKVKQFKVVRGQKYKGAWILKEMRIESYDPLKSGDLIGRTYMQIKDPE